MLWKKYSRLKDISSVGVKSRLRFYIRLLGQVLLIRWYTCKHWGKEQTDKGKKNTAQCLKWDMTYVFEENREVIVAEPASAR